MTTKDTSLEDLRADIDRIDDRIHDLIMERTAIVEEIAARKQSRHGYIRPAREALILRRLVARHQGHFPTFALLRLWREMIVGLTQVQSPLTVAVCTPPGRGRSFWDMARDHYGSCTPLTPVNSALAAVRAVSEGTATVGVVPFPADGEADPWWRYLSGAEPEGPRVIARLPFFGHGPGRSSGDGEAVAVAMAPLEPSGDDRTLLRVDLSDDISRGRLKAALDAVGLPVVTFFRSETATAPTGCLHLVEIGDFVAPDDGRLKECADHLGSHRLGLATIGGYAVPLQLPSSLDAREARVDPGNNEAAAAAASETSR